MLLLACALAAENGAERLVVLAVPPWASGKYAGCEWVK